MRFACPHCHDPAARPMVRSLGGWIEYTGSGSTWHCSELHCSECHRPVVIEPPDYAAIASAANYYLVAYSDWMDEAGP